MALGLCVHVGKKRGVVGHTHLFSLELFCLIPIFQRLSKLYIYFRKFVCISFYFNQLSPVKTVSWLTLEI